MNIIGTTLDVNIRVDMRYVMSFEDGVDYGDAAEVLLKNK